MIYLYYFKIANSVIGCSSRDTSASSRFLVQTEVAESCEVWASRRNKEEVVEEEEAEKRKKKY